MAVLAFFLNETVKRSSQRARRGVAGGLAMQTRRTLTSRSLCLVVGRVVRVRDRIMRGRSLFVRFAAEQTRLIRLFVGRFTAAQIGTSGQRCHQCQNMYRFHKISLESGATGLKRDTRHDVRKQIPVLNLFFRRARTAGRLRETKKADATESRGFGNQMRRLTR